MARQPKRPKAKSRALTSTTAKDGKAPTAPSRMTKAALADEVRALRARLADLERGRAGDDAVGAADALAHQHIYDILDSSPIGSTIVRDDGSFEFVNSRMAEMVGLTREQLMARHARDL